MESKIEPMKTRKPRTRPPYERLLWLDSQVRERRCLPLSEYCRHFEINIRTAYRDTDFLKYNLDAPLEYDPKRRGWRYTDPSFRLPAVTLTEGELVALFLAEKALRSQAGGPHEAELRAAFEKLCRALPESVTVDLGAWEETISFAGAPTRPVEAQTYRRVLEAVQKRRQLRLRYYAASRDAEGERTVDPHHLHNHAGDWYLIAWDQGRGAFRDFALSRIRGLEPTGQGFGLRSDFDRRAYLAEHFGGFRGGEPVEVVVRFDAYQSRWMREKSWPGEAGREEQADGSLNLRLRVTSLEGVLRWVLQYGSHVEALQPEELRAAVVAEARKMAEMYREEDDGLPRDSH